MKKAVLMIMIALFTGNAFASSCGNKGEGRITDVGGVYSDNVSTQGTATKGKR